MTPCCRTRTEVYSARSSTCACSINGRHVQHCFHHMCCSKWPAGFGDTHHRVQRRLGGQTPTCLILFAFLHCEHGCCDTFLHCEHGCCDTCHIACSRLRGSLVEDGAVLPAMMGNRCMVHVVSVCWSAVTLTVSYQRHCLKHEVNQALAAAVEPHVNAGAFLHV